MTDRVICEQIVIDESVLSLICEQARKDYPEEGCGLLFEKDGIIEDAVPIRNSAGTCDASSRYLMDPKEVYEAERSREKEGLYTAGVYHSHPDLPAVLSGEDERLMIPEQVYVIISVNGREIQEINAFIKPLDTMTAVRLEIKDVR